MPYTFSAENTPLRQSQETPIHTCHYPDISKEALLSVYSSAPKKREQEQRRTGGYPEGIN
jgi:hypothetical protein